MRINILVDAIHLLSPKTGIGKYTFENCMLLETLTIDKFIWHYNYGYISHKLIDADSKHDSNKINNIVRRLKRLISKYPFVKYTAKMLVNITQRFSPKMYDLYWQPNYIPSNSINAKKIITTIHDLSFLMYPEWHPPDRSKYLNKNIFRAIERSDRIIAVSRFTKEEIIQHTGYDPAKITVIYNGVDHKVFKVYSDEELESFKKHYNLPDQFLLFVGSIEPRKNLYNLLQAYKGYNSSNQDALPLILVGFSGWQNKEIIKMILSLNGKVKYLGYLSDQELSYIYNLATIFVYPSFYEGFGIPPLEAMACGTPVITSNTTSIPEICGNAVLYVDPSDQLDIKNTIELLIEKEDLRKELVNKGLERSKHFSWERSAQEHLELFERVMNL